MFAQVVCNSEGVGELRGVIFDFNGTMVFDEKFHMAAWKKFLAEKLGEEISDEEYRNNFQAIPADVTVRKYFDKVGDAEIVELVAEKEKIYRELCKADDDWKLADGLEKFLDMLKENKIPFTIATSAPLENVKFFFENINLAKWFNFEYVVYDDGTLPGKPAPDIFLKAAEVLGVEISDCVIFEDSRSGIRAAKHAHANKIVGVTSTLSEEELLQVGANVAIADYKNLDLLSDLITREDFINDQFIERAF